MRLRGDTHSKSYQNPLICSTRRGELGIGAGTATLTLVAGDLNSFAANCTIVPPRQILLIQKFQAVRLRKSR